MAYLADILTEIANIADIAKLRGDSDMVQGLVESTATKIATVVHSGSGSIVSLTKALATSGLQDSYTQIVQVAIDNRTSSYTSNVAGRKASSGAPPRDQTMRHMYNFLTTKDWGVLTDPKSSSQQRDHVLLQRLSRLGIRRASEEGLIKWYHHGG